MELRRNSQTHYWTIGLTQHGEISARPIPAPIMGGAGNKLSSFISRAHGLVHGPEDRDKQAEGSPEL
jgi:hypothetical protein